MPVESVCAFAPGRVNLIGEFTDYNDGLALPFAIAEGVTVRARADGDGDREIEAHALDLHESDRFALAEPRPAEGWRSFVRGTVAELNAAGYRLRPARLEIEGRVPRGSGLSSSAALEVALSLALLALGSSEQTEHLDRLALARVCSRVENDWVGAQTGLLDQLASLCGEPDAAVRIDFRTLEIAPVPLALGDWSLAVLDSGEPHVHASSGYNQRRLECTEARARMGLASMRDATLAQAEALPDPLRRRVRHLIGENERVEQTIAALGAGELARVGALLDASHVSLREDFEVGTPAVERAVERLREAGAAGARMVGGGFGGSVLGLFPPGVQPPPGARAVRPGPGAHVGDLTG